MYGFLTIIIILIATWLGFRLLSTKLNGLFNQMQLWLERRLGEALLQQQKEVHQTTQEMILLHNKAQAQLFDMLKQGLLDVQQQVQHHLQQHTYSLVQQIDKLVQTTDERLREISGQVESRLKEGFDKTTATFTDILQRLALIDDAQRRLTELSSNVVSLQQVLSDKRSRGAFGEIQLKNLVENLLPAHIYAFQHTFSNQMRADCVLFFPKPTGHLVIDAKFPLENYHKLSDFAASEPERKKAQQLFRQDLKRHVQDVAGKYIIPGETADGVILFIPAEAVFAEIHAHFNDVVELAQRQSVWLTSPNTLMAVLTTAQAILREHDSREHMDVIRQHLLALKDHFKRFDIRMQNLAKHIEQANQDVQQVQISAKKITQRFQQIEQGDSLLQLEADDGEAVA